MDREEIREQFSPILDDELTSDERASIESELAQDAELLRELHALKRVDELYRRMPPVQAPAGFETGVRAKLRPNVLRIPAAVFTRRRVAGLVAAAAILVLVTGVVVTQFGPRGGRFNMAALSKTAPEPSVQAEKSAQFQERAPAASTDAAAPVPQSFAPVQNGQQAESFNDFDYARGGGGASSRRGGESESYLARREPAKATLSDRGARGAAPVDTSGDFTAGNREMDTSRKDGADAKGVEQGTPAGASLHDEREQEQEKQLNSLGYLSSEQPKPESAAANVELRNMPKAEEPAGEAEAGMGRPVAEESLSLQKPPAPAPPVMANETPPPLVPADQPSAPAIATADARGREDWDFGKKNKKTEKAESGETASTEALAAPAAAPASSQAVGQDRAEQVDGLQNVQVGGQIRIGGVMPPAPEAERMTPQESKVVGVEASPAAPATPESVDKPLPDTKRIIGERVFDLRDGVWRQAEYNNETVVLLDRASDVAKQLIEKDPTLKDVLALDKPVIFRAQDRWYRVESAKK